MFTAPAGNWGVVRSLSLTIEFASKLAGILPKFLPCRGGSVRPRSGLERGGYSPSAWLCRGTSGLPPPLCRSPLIEYIAEIFYNRALSCLVPIELKIGKFKPEHIGQINFYLEALDRDVKKPNENPSVGLILCASKDDAVVEYALSRSMSPTLVSDYTLCLPDKQILKDKLQELAELALEDGEEMNDE